MKPKKSKKFNNKYIILVVSYFHEDEPNNVARITAAVTDMLVDETVEIQEFWLDKYSLPTINQKIKRLAKKFKTKYF
jgi:hypothetical protein